jgi:atypical dual specificity phosphatase
VSRDFGPLVLEKGVYRWLVPGVLAGGPHPRTGGAYARNLEHLTGAGFGGLVSLCERDDAPPEASDLEFLHVPTPDGEPPGELVGICHFIDGVRARGAATFVHCLAGLGRTGTVLGAYLVWRERLRAWDAIEEVRRRYCQSAIETPAQYDALQAFERRCRLF